MRLLFLSSSLLALIAFVQPVMAESAPADTTTEAAPVAGLPEGVVVATTEQIVGEWAIDVPSAMAQVEARLADAPAEQRDQILQMMKAEMANTRMAITEQSMSFIRPGMDPDVKPYTRNDDGSISVEGEEQKGTFYTTDGSKLFLVLSGQGDDPVMTFVRPDNEGDAAPTP